MYIKGFLRRLRFFNSEICYIADWTVNDYNTQTAQYFKK